METLVLLLPGKGHDVPRVSSGDSGPHFIGLWLFQIFPFSLLLPFTHVWLCFSSILTSLATYPIYLLPTPFYSFFFFWSDLVSYTFCRTHFFTPLSTSVHLSVTLISVILLAFSSSFFLYILLLEFAIACCIYQIPM